MNEQPATDLRSPQDSVALDWSAVGAHLAKHGLRLDTAPPPRQFAGGLANHRFPQTSGVVFGSINGRA